MNKQGFVDQIVTLEELARVGSSQPLYMHNYGKFGEVECEFTISDGDNLLGKVRYWRDQQEKQGGNIID